MPSLRVFVSHSAKEADSIAALKMLANRLADEPQRFTLLMDRPELKPGDRWRARINLWMGACDAAVVLLSPSALTSAYVAYEVSVLSYRASIPGSRFRIIPVYLKGVKPERIEKSLLDPARLTENQALANLGTAEEIADAVVAELTKIAERPERPIDRVIQRVKSLLYSVPSSVIDAASAKLPELKLPWEPGGDTIGPFAERLLGIGMIDAIDALIELSTVLNEAKMKDLVDLVACTWVDLKAVESLPQIARSDTRRAVALNAMRSETARMYKLAASGGSPNWLFVPCDNVWEVHPQSHELESGERSVADQVTEKVRATLRSSWHLSSREELEQKLEGIKKHFVVLVAMPAPGLVEDPDVARALRKAFPTVTFFFLTGGTSAEAGDEVAYPITPRLQDSDEEEFLSAQKELEVNVLWPMQIRG